MTRTTFAIAVALVAAICSAEVVKVTEGTRTILTGPYKFEKTPPQGRPEDFQPIDHPAVYIENEYLRCCVLPGIGGRLYEVFSKASNSQMFFVNPYLETHEDDHIPGPWNLGGVEVNFPYFHHGNSYNDRWQWAPIGRDDGSAGVEMSFTSRPTMQRAVFRVLLRPAVASVFLEYRFENMNEYSWGLAAWIDTMHTKTLETEFILPVPWVAQHGHNRGRNDLQPWPVRDGVDLSWQKNLDQKWDLSEFGYNPRERFHGCYDHAADRGAVRIFDPATLPAMKLWTQALPVAPDRYYQHFEIWTATSPVMEDPRRQPEFSAWDAADSWYQAWGTGGYVYANEYAAINLKRQQDGSLLAGVCGTRPIPCCVISLTAGHNTFFREQFDLDPARPWRREMPASPGDITMEIAGPDGTTLVSYEHREDQLPHEQWIMPETPRWKEGINAAYYDEDYSTLWRWRGNFLDSAIRRYRQLLEKQPESTALMIDLARAHLKDHQVRIGSWYRNPGPEADADAAKRREEDIAAAIELLNTAIERDPADGNAHHYLGIALERRGKRSEAAAAYRKALDSGRPAPAAGILLARLLIKDDPAQAADLAVRAAALYPQSIVAKRMEIAALAAAGRKSEAFSKTQQLLDANPSDPVALSLMARLHAGTPAESPFRQQLDRLLAGDPVAQDGLQQDLQWLRGE